MISNLFIIFFISLSYAFSVIVITDQNSHCEFDIRRVDCIGQIEIDSSFIDYVMNKNDSYWFCRRHLFVGTDLQNQLLDYIKGKVYLGLNAEEEDKLFKYVHKLIHDQKIDDPEKNVSITGVILYLSLFSFNGANGMACVSIT